MQTGKKQRSITTLRDLLVKIDAKIVRPSLSATLHMPENHSVALHLAEVLTRICPAAGAPAPA